MIIINIGIDIGGNHTGIGIVDSNGEILELKVYDYDNATLEVNTVFDFINDFLYHYEDYPIDSIGIGVPGIVSETKIHYTCNMPIENIDVCDYLGTKIPIYLSNDANCATIAEYQLIDNKFYSNYAFVTVGTGIGSGLILNGDLYSGSSNTAGELGHMVIEKDGIQCKCGRKGCFEKYASTSALKKKMDLNNLDEIFYLAETNPVIQNLLDEYLECLSEGLANFVNLFDVEMLVIGGQISKYGNYFMPRLKSKMIEKIFNHVTYELNLKTAQLANNAGIIGASFLSEYLK